ncbi:hypothetical protein E1B28_009726 [Marasmius oreades]|uniref:Uncharacterized protein n=1 Tax=Marasmius oreades TaxID=181124 RepID=A0A9P7RVN1_9AGAR|nr:uncharacterized protein E1B28_009726 [Marasmius oreades]KAG7090624.1 hypothetical protein E1B28_009726 [Marasmius oreades]
MCHTGPQVMTLPLPEFLIPSGLVILVLDVHQGWKASDSHGILHFSTGILDGEGSVESGLGDWEGWEGFGVSRMVVGGSFESFGSDDGDSGLDSLSPPDCVLV